MKGGENAAGVDLNLMELKGREDEREGEPEYNVECSFGKKCYKNHAIPHTTQGKSICEFSYIKSELDRTYYSFAINLGLPTEFCW